MNIISLVSQKGGCGKSTLAVNLAGTATDKTLLIDLDPQHSASDWWNARPDEYQGLPEFIGDISIDQLPNAIKQASNHDIMNIIIDTAGRDSPATKKILQYSDLVLIPVGPTSMDLKATVKTLGEVTDKGVKSAFVINNAYPQGQRNSKARTLLSQIGTVVPVDIVRRVEFQDSFAFGECAGGKGRTEIDALWKWINNHL